MATTLTHAATVLFCLFPTLAATSVDEPSRPAGPPGTLAPIVVEQPTVRAAGRGQPWISLRDGRRLAVRYAAGVMPAPESLVATALARTDFDGDGLQDVVAAYASPTGGLLAVHPADPTARRVRGADASPFFPDVRTAVIPVAPDFVATGDFDADGFGDVVVAAREGQTLWWLAGSAAGELGPPRAVQLAGVVTAIVAGEIGRPDGRDDLAVGVLEQERAGLLVFSHRGGALRQSPTTLPVTGRVDALTLIRFGSSRSVSLVVATGRELHILPGPAEAREPAQLEFASPIRGLTAGAFEDGELRGNGVAVLLDDGTLRWVRPTGPTSRPSEGFTIVADASGNLGASEVMVAANLSNRPGHDLLLCDPAGRRLLVRVGGLPRAEWVELPAAAAPLAILPMRLNDDAFDDLVVLFEDATVPTVLLTAAAHVFTVDAVGDAGDTNHGDGQAVTATGDCTLRAALEEANASPGTDEIRFAIDGPGPHTIQPGGPLPAIVDPIILDATSEPDWVDDPVVEVDGQLAGQTDGLALFAGSSTVRGLAINRFAFSGIAVFGSGAVDNRIHGNHVGTDTSGTSARPNLGNGVIVVDGARGTIVGTDGDGVDDAAEGNLVSGNLQTGIVINGPGTDENVVAGNRVGTNASGTAALGNGEFGIAIVVEAAGNRIGTDGNGVADAAEGNLVSGNIVRGILVAMEAEQNVVAGNLVGTDSTGTAALPNLAGGIEIANGARETRVGTDADGLADDLERNVISGNHGQGIVMFGEPLVEDSVIAGNFIGTDVSGSVALGNGDSGVSIGESVNTVVGGATPAARNILSGNGGNGVYVAGQAAHDNHIAGNFIGTDVTGTTALGNGGNGVFVSNSPRNTIGVNGDGVDDAAEGNLISANAQNGVTLFGLEAQENVVAGNLIGTDASGNAALGNGESGVVVIDQPLANRIGTDGDGVSDLAERNVVSGNTILGVLIAWYAEQTVVAGNYIGTDTTGTQALPNSGGGIELSNGVDASRIGTDANGVSDSLERNLISGNTAYGITLFGEPSSDGNVIAGNFIGTQADGASPLPNTSHGILIFGEANDTLIGGLGVAPGSCDGPCNRIAFNGSGASQDGVRIAAGTGNAVLGNVIHSNFAGGAIDIAAAGVSPNDPGDLDGGANNTQNYPLLTLAETSGGTTTIQGILASVPTTDFRLEFYANAVCDNSGYGEAETLATAADVTTAADGTVAFAVPVAALTQARPWLSATATRLDPSGQPIDTSELSPCLALGAAAPAGRVPDGSDVPGTQLLLNKGAGSNVQLSWGASCLASDIDYAVYMGELGDFTSHWGRACSSQGLTEKQIWTTQDRVYYLIVPLNNAREGSYGTDSDGSERPTGVSTCRPQSIGECP